MIQEFTTLGRSLLPWLGINVNKPMIRKFSSIIKITAESAAKATEAQQPSLDSLAKALRDSRTALDYLLGEQGGTPLLWSTPPAVSGLTLLGILET